MSVQLITYNESLVTPLHDAVIHDMALANNGMFFGGEVTIVNSNTINVTNGIGICYGREFEITSEELTVPLASSGTLKGRVYLHIDLANISEPIQLLTQTATTLPALVDNPNINKLNGVTDLELATFDVGQTEIANVVNTVAQVQKTQDLKTATTTSNGLMSAADKQKLNGIATGANKYALPAATSSTLGGIKVGTNLSINSGGVLSATNTTYSNATTSAAGLMSAADKTKLNSILADATNTKVKGSAESTYRTGNVNITAENIGVAAGATNTKVKGNAETDYRTGNVNLTPANIGALALSGGTLTGDLKLMSTAARQISLQNETVDTKNSVNGITTDTAHSFYVKDKNGYFNGGYVVNYLTNGNIESYIRVQNRNTSGTAQTNARFGLTQAKDGTTDYIVSSPAKLTAKLTEATSSAKGLLSASDKTKLNGIDENANSVKTAFGVYNAGTFTKNQGKEITVSTGKPSGTILACIPIGAGGSVGSGEGAYGMPIGVAGVTGGTLSNNKLGKFYLINPSSVTVTDVKVTVIWLYV